MATLSREDVLKLAKLARLELSDEEIDRFRGEISAILQYVEKLQAIDLNNLQPTSQVTGLVNVMRPDSEIDYSTTREALMRNLPSSEKGQIKVRRMLT